MIHSYAYDNMLMYVFFKDGHRRADPAGAGGEPAQRPHRPIATAAAAAAGDAALRSRLREHRDGVESQAKFPHCQCKIVCISHQT